VADLGGFKVSTETPFHPQLFNNCCVGDGLYFSIGKGYKDIQK